MAEDKSFFDKVSAFVSDFLSPKDATARGYADGWAAATHEGKPLIKDIPHRIHAIRALSPSSSSQMFYDSYKEGYDKGYMDGLRKRHDTQTIIEDTTPTKSNINFSSNNATASMSDKASYERQLELTQQLIKSLERLNENLDKAQKSYAQKIDQLERAGLMSNTIARLREDKHPDLKTKIDSLTQRISERDIKFLQGLERLIEEAISAA